ncbi:MAG: hypothetical protein EPN37_16280 [Chitinophagaceae bacterium]|nr:MAG: hypothetical protein EPN37_16280 [Chitinophagaceae bacterium]
MLNPYSYGALRRVMYEERLLKTQSGRKPVESIRNEFVRNNRKLNIKATMQKLPIANSDKPIAFYSLDVIISVGYRVKSKLGTQFRQWAIQRLLDELLK